MFSDRTYHESTYKEVKSMTKDNSAKKQPDLMSDKDAPTEEMEKLQRGMANSDAGATDNTRKQ